MGHIGICDCLQFVVCNKTALKFQQVVAYGAMSARRPSSDTLQVESKYAP